MGEGKVSSEGPFMWEHGFGEIPLLFIPREDRSEAEIRGSCSYGQQHFHAGLWQDGCAWGILKEPERLRGPCIHAVPQPMVLVRCWTSCTHLGSQQSAHSAGQAAAAPPQRQLSAPTQLPANSSFSIKRNKLIQM